EGHVIEHDDSAHYETPFRAGCGKTAGAGSWSGGAARCRRGGVVAGTFIGGRRAWGGQPGGTVLGRAAVRLGLVAGGGRGARSGPRGGRAAWPGAASPPSICASACWRASPSAPASSSTA